MMPAELQISATQRVPWHYHTAIQDTFYVLEGHLRLQLRDRVAAELQQRVLHAALQGRAGIVAEVVAVLRVHRFQQQAHLDIGGGGDVGHGIRRTEHCLA